MNKIFKSALAAAVLIALSSLGGTAYAATATSDLPVSASVTATCTIDASGGLAFGAYDPVVTNASTDLTGQGTIDTTCTNGASVTVTLGQGANADTGSSDAAPVRRMLSGASDYLSYQLYSDSGRSTVWGNTAGTGAPVTGTGTVVSTTVYGLITAGQNVPSGSYSDTVVATVTF
ncbi:Csu type fimbrial protein [Frateuria terrea]|uniref:Spore coat protein U (SCPU) domain-containing protein n=1 Tax=Frateuria terrea TaxID=529704 RepID=A0A1H6UCW1_9GAMM|nr:spore coat U domain-containing protein [Frateuria terrea]SEI88474.1 Spore coat protein U (SCPU) domain-containing protein [Frateuria terrea]SFP37720.1 Spore coat protein U (SCPU) domain-containing protein [Frateuria terrea]